MNKFRLTSLFIAVLCILGLFAFITSARADGEHPHPKHNLARQSQNPVSTLMSVPLENNFNFNAGPEDQTDYILGDQWTVPFGGGFGKVFKMGKQPVNAKLA